MRSAPRGPRSRWILIALGLAALALALPRVVPPARSPSPTGDSVGRTAPAHPEESGDGAIAEAFRGRQSGVWVSASGVVERLLADDREGSPHQRFVLRLDGGQTLLFAHNLDLAPRVPLRSGDRVRFRGQYEWNARGGVIHWTHHDPEGGPGGWIEVGGKTYR